MPSPEDYNSAGLAAGEDAPPDADTPEAGESFSLAGAAVVVLDRSFRVMGSNTSARRLMAHDLEPNERFHLERFFQGPCLAEVHQALDRALGRGEVCQGRRAQVSDRKGRAFAVSYSVNPLFGPSRQITGVILTLRDDVFAPIAARLPRPGESPANLPRLGYQTLFEHLAEGIFTINTSWRVTSFNQTAEALTGYRREEVLGRYCWDIFRSNLCEGSCPLRTTLETGLTRRDQDVRMLSKGGKTFTVLVNTSVVKDSGGNVVGAVETFRPLNGGEDSSRAGGERQSFKDIIGASPPMQRLFSLLPDLAATEASVLISGESGTGKELFARAIHHQSPRAEGPFVAVNCSALAETLLESELFGHEKAAFTGAMQAKVGRFELAKGGTLFLDEIGDLKPELQVKLLRVIEQRVFERVGGTRLIPMEARIISATHRDLKKALAQGGFREDLYYRLRTVPLNIPPLRQRREDIPLLVEHFVARLNQRYGKEVRAVDPKVMRFFMGYEWPGNVRELERVLEYAFVFVKGPVIFLGHLPEPAEFAKTEDGPGATAETEGETREACAPDEAERKAISAALDRCGGRRAKAAEILGISRTSLWRRMKALGLD